jgi:alpha-L-fucosidase 2
VSQRKLCLSFAAVVVCFFSQQILADGLKANIEYGEAAGEKLLLDAHVPEGAGPFPIAILIHGGGWGSGSKEGDITPLLDPLSAANVTWFSINYRLAPKNRWPACFEDVQTAIRWVKAHAAEYKGEPGKIALIGYSAGGHLASLAAVMADDGTRVQAVVCFAAPTDMPADTARRGGLSVSMQALLDRPEVVDATTSKQLEKISPIYHLKPGLPPFLLIHGTEDKSVSYVQSVNLQAKLKENNVPCELVTLQGASHRLREWEQFDPAYKDRMTDWLRKTLGGHVIVNGAPISQP